MLRRCSRTQFLSARKAPRYHSRTALYAAAFVVLTASASAIAQETPAGANGQSARPAPSFTLYESHVEWKDDCMPKTVGDPNGPGYIIYHSHVEWRNDEVPVPAERKPGPEFRVFDSHIDRTDECSLHPIVMAPQVPSRG